MNDKSSPLFWFDAHLDLAYMEQSGRDMLASDPAVAGGDNLPACITLPSLERGGVKWVLATIFTETNAPQHPYGYGDWNDVDGARAAGVAQLEIYKAWEAKGLVRIIRSASDLDLQPAADAPLQIIILMEGADPIASVDDASWWFTQGVRVVSLCWSHGSRYSAGNAMPSSQGGLTDLGKSLVTRFDELGIIHDLTHLNDASATQLLSQTTGGVIASHSASRSMQASCPMEIPGVDTQVVMQRHIHDDHVKAIKERGGVIGLPLYDRFLAQTAGQRTTMSRVIDHLDYLADKLATSSEPGRRRIGIGSDYDGGFSALQTPDGLEGPEKLASLAQAMAARGWPAASIADIAHNNWLRYFKQTLPRVNKA